MEQELLQEIASYWGTRAEGYSEVNEKELAGSQREAWLHVLEEQFPEKKKEEMKILDIGTGPGFFPMILSEAGYTVAAVDYTEEMLEKAKENLGKYTKYGLERVTSLMPYGSRPVGARTRRLPTMSGQFSSSFTSLYARPKLASPMAGPDETLASIGTAVPVWVM